MLGRAFTARQWTSFSLDPNQHPAANAFRTRADVSQSCSAALGKENDESKPLQMMRGLQLVTSQLPVNFSVLTLVSKIVEHFSWSQVPKVNIGNTIYSSSSYIYPCMASGKGNQNVSDKCLETSDIWWRSTARFLCWVFIRWARVKKMGWVISLNFRLF